MAGYIGKGKAQSLTTVPTDIDHGLNIDGNVDVTGTATMDGLTVDGATRVNDSEFLIADNNTATTAKLSMVIDTTNGARIRTSINGAATVQPLGIYTGSTLRQKYDTNGDISFYEDTGTTAKFFWDASAESLGIGTSSPTEKLHVEGEIVAGTSGYTSGRSGNTGLVSYNSSTLVEDIDALYLRKEGTNDSSVGIAFGNASGDNPFVGARIKHVRSGSNSNGHLTFETKNDSSISDTTERMRIDSSGNLLVGTTSGDSKLSVSGYTHLYTGGSNPDSTTNTYVKGLTITGGNMRLNMDVSSTTNGGAYIQTRHASTAYPNAYYVLRLNPLGGTVYANASSISDKRYKKDLVVVDNALDKLCTLTGYTYERIDVDEGVRHAGLIAQEINEILPEAITYDEAEDKYGVLYANLSALYVEAIKELKTTNDSLVARIETLETKVATLEGGV